MPSILHRHLQHAKPNVYVSLSELNGVVPSTLFGVFCPLEGWGSRTCEESADGELAIIYGHLPEADKKM
jgi:hypothetical protein